MHRAEALVYISLLLQLASVGHSIPAFNQVNGWDINGAKCPLPTKYNAECPPLCVSNLLNCPSSLSANCPEGQSFCMDGTCKTSCSGVRNPCQCDSDSPISLFPCRVGTSVTIRDFNASDSTQIAYACASTLGISNISVGFDPQSDAMWLKCPPRAPQSFSWVEPRWLSVWILLSFFFGIMALWTVYKKSRERNIVLNIHQNSHISSYKDEKLRDGDDEVSLDSIETLDSASDHLTLKGFRNDAFGRFMLLLVILYTLGWFVWLAILTIDFYGNINGRSYGLFFESFYISSVNFIIVWYIAALWLIVLNVSRGRLRNFFRLQCMPTNAQFIEVTKKQKPMHLVEDSSRALYWLHKFENKFKLALGLGMLVETVPLQKTKSGTLFFKFQCARYIYNPEKNVFGLYQYYLGTTNRELLEHSEGLSTEEAQFRMELVGENFISVYVPSFFSALAREFFRYFYLYQFMVLWLFYYYAYYVIGIVDTVVILLSALIKVYVRLKSEHRIKEMAEHVDTCTVLRDGKMVQLSTADLVCGDVFEVREGITVPCDAVLLSGYIIANESSLTGEPRPTRKSPIKDDEEVYSRVGRGKNSTLFAGTSVSETIHALSSKEDSCSGAPRALVTHTGIQTDKGQLVQKILYPTEIKFIFNEQIKVVMVCNPAMLGNGMFCTRLTPTAVCWNGSLVFRYSSHILHKLPYNDSSINLVLAMFNICQLISPLLPAALVVGQSVAAGRLRSRHIYCVDLPRVIIAGKVCIFCFDKTGTLTKEGLEFYGVQPLETANMGEEEKISYNPSGYLGKLLDKPVEFPHLLQIGTASCHDVTRVSEQLVGNPVDIEMFSATDWKLLANTEYPQYNDTLMHPTTNELLHVIRRFEFVHARMSMSVVVLEHATRHVHVFVKGSFEKIREIATPSSFPQDYDMTTTKLAREGCYVLAMAHRDLGEIDPDVARNMTREELEAGTEFLGLVLFKNQLKEDTAQAIAELKRGGTRTVMITGDNALTGVFIARKCAMTSSDARILLGDIVEEKLVWQDVDTAACVGLDNVAELAVTGRAFQYLVESKQIRQLLLRIRVFARMTPNDKVNCVQLHMERGITAMCGDGGNDCGALRAAHVGLALSEAEASIVSPFSTNRRTIMSCVELLRQGRGALATNFAGYKYLIMYGQTMVMLKIFTAYFSVALSQALAVMIDAFITVLLSYAVTQARPAKRLAPKRPTARLLGVETLTSTIGQVIINWVFLIGAMGLLYSQEWFRCHEFDSSRVDASKWWLLGDNYETAVLAYTTLFQFVNSALVFNFGYVYRQTWWRNYILVGIAVIYFVIISYMLLADPNPLGCLMRLNCGSTDALTRLGYGVPWFSIEKYNSNDENNILPRDFRFKLWGLCIANMISAIMFELVVVLGPIRQSLIRRRHRPQMNL
ncbi:uncharacterized protein VTP21DRAFT_9408 [Calcarisporiella thermophila]|uniref:uncharacterized protein n=1 Tax=Calcarisporiella thermophila TaxID=911321 RepID=UPI003743AFDB